MEFLERKEHMTIPKAYATAVQKRAVDMTLSVNPLGCSPRARKAANAQTTTGISLYPDAGILIRALSQKFNVPENGILVANGSEALIKLISDALLSPGKTAAVESGSFFLFSKEPKLTGATVRFFDNADSTRFKKRPDLLFVANPTTPGGVNRTNDVLLSTIDRLNPVVAVVDEANAEYANDTMIRELPKKKNLIVLRTFSKVYGLAGLRIGMAFGNPFLINRIREYQQPFPVTSTGIAAAIAALSDDTFIEKTKRFVASERTMLTKALVKRNFTVSQSVTNNLFVTRPDNDVIVQELEKLGVSVINGSFFPGNTVPGFRISVKDKRTNRLFLQKLDEALACVSKYNLLPSKEAV